ncbi:MAG: tetratricopeptide repeat protein [Agriterribacter sp.]
MKRLICLLCSFSMMLICKGQANVRDSLLGVLGGCVQKDTLRLNTLIAAAAACRYDSAELGIKLTGEAIQLAEKLKSMVNLGHAYHIRGICYYTKGDFQTDIEFQKKAFTIYMKAGDSLQAGSALNRIGTAYTSLSDYPQALQYLQQAEKLADDGNIRRVKPAVKANVALVYYYLADYTKSLEYNQKAIELYKELNSTANVAVVLNNIGDIYLKTGDYNRAIALNREAFQLNRSTVNSTKGEANIYLAIGMAYKFLHNYDSAMYYLGKSLTMYKSLNATHKISLSLTEIAAIYAFAPDNVFDLSLNKRLKIALDYQNEALLLAKQTGTLDNISNQWKTLSEIYEKAGNKDSALQAYKSYFAIHDSIAGDKIRKEVARKEIQAEADKKDAILNEKHTAEIKQQETTRKAYLIGAGLILISSLLIFYLYLRRRNARAKQVEAELKAEITDTEMKALRSQMNPHFIFNSLNSIRHYIVQNNIKLADEYLVRFSLLMRQVFENSDHQKVSLADDLHALELYMQIEAARLDNKFNYEIQVDETIDVENTMISPLLLQPFVENSIWHGITPKNSNGTIKIGVSRQLGMICCVVEDNGVGIKKEVTEQKEKEEKKDKPSGIAITRTRIDLMNRAQNTNASLQIYSLNEGTKVEINLPLELNF